MHEHWRRKADIQIRLRSPARGAERCGRLAVAGTEPPSPGAELGRGSRCGTGVQRRLEERDHCGNTHDRAVLPDLGREGGQVGKAYYVLNSRLDTLMTKDASRISDNLLQKQ
jgi:hypothetical protein